jgi:hypothetical protein
MTTPTPAQLAAANLIELPSNVDVAIANGWPVRTFDSVHAKFPPVNVNQVQRLYVSAGWKTPKHPLVTDYPSGLTPPPVSAGYKRLVFEDFLSMKSPIFSGAYNGTPGGTHGHFDQNHVVQKGDSLLRLQFYETAGDDPSDNNNAGAGINTNGVYDLPVGTKVYVARQTDVHPDVAAINLLMALDTWPGEIDFCEKGYAYIHWDADDKQKGFGSPVGGENPDWHIWGAEYLTSVINLTIDGRTWASFPNPTSDPTNVNGLLRPMFLSCQLQDGDGTYPTAAIPQSQLVEMRVDWICIDVPA